MSRSRKKPYVKDDKSQDYWARIRREWRQQLTCCWHDEEFELRLPKEIVNDYDYRDYSSYHPTDVRSFRK